METRSTPCDLCDDDATDCYMPDTPYAYHLACIRYRIANPDSNRQLRGMRNLLDMVVKFA